jgi:hypothetical protein
MTDFDQKGQRVFTQFNVGEITIHLQGSFPADVVSELKSAVRSVQLGRYIDAVTRLDALVLRDDAIADIYYYRALALLNGQRPNLVRRSIAEKIELDLDTSCRLDDSQAHPFYLWALLKYDFYAVHGFRVREPGIENLLECARQRSLDAPKGIELLRHTNAPDCPVSLVLKERISKI